MINKFKNILLGIFGFIVLIIIFGVFSGSADENNNTTGLLEDSEVSSSTPTNTNKEYVVGDIIQLKNHQIRINSFKQGYKSNNQFSNPQSSSNEFVTIDVEFLNNGDNDSLSVNGWGFELEDEAGVQRDVTFVQA